MRSQSTRSESLLLSSTTHLRHQSYSWLSSNIQCSNSLWSIEFVTTDGHQVDIHLINIERYLADRLGRIRVKEDLVLSAELSDFFDWLYYTDFVVNHYHRDHYCVRSNSLPQILHIEDPVCSNIQVCDLKTLILKMSATIKDAFMLNLSCNDMLLLSILSVKLRDTLQGEVVALCCSTREDDFFRRSSNQVCHMLQNRFRHFYFLTSLASSQAFSVSHP